MDRRSLMPGRASLAMALPLAILLGCDDFDSGVVDGGVYDGSAHADSPGNDADSTNPGPDGSSGGRVELGPEPFTIVVLPDTQFYIQSYFEIFEAQVAWIVRERLSRNIQVVLHEGDLVETPTLQPEWERANTALGTLDGMVPYVLSAGNHDIIVTTREAPLLNRTFPVSRFSPHLKGTFQPEKIQNAYYEVRLGGRQWLIVSLEFGPRNEVLGWAESILKARAELPAIVLTHAYMYVGQQRYDHVKHPEPMQYWNPHAYPLPGSINDGEEMWQKLVSKNHNVLFAFSGHATREGGAVGRVSTQRANGGWVHEMLANYQGCPSDYMCVYPGTMRPMRGGEGFLRIVRVEPAQGRALVETYSPFLGEYRTDPDNQFELSLP